MPEAITGHSGYFHAYRQGQYKYRWTRVTKEV